MNGISSREKRSTARASRPPRRLAARFLRIIRLVVRGPNNSGGAVAAAEAFDDAVSQLETGFANALQNQFAAAARLRHRIAPDNRQRSGRSEAVAIRGADFVRLRPRLARCAAHSHAIVAEIFDRQRKERNRDVGAEIVVRVADFVDELFLYRHRRDAAARAARLGDDAASVFGDFDDRKSDVRGVGHVEPVGADAAGDLRAAFDQMAGDRRAGQSIEFIVAPAEVMDAGATTSDGSATRP